MKIRMSRSNISRRSFLASSLATAAACGGGRLKGDPDGRKVIVLGLDGMEPKIIKALMDTGRAPNFKKLSQMGGFQPLGTTIPALSPVAWSSFITGMSPGGHGIPDFIARDPLTYQPFFSIWEARDIEQSIQLGDYNFGISGGEVENLRSGKPFWAYLTEQGIPATVIKIPTNFPVEETATRAISGMGTPDVVDSFGVFTYFTSDPDDEDAAVAGGEDRASTGPRRPRRPDLPRSAKFTRHHSRGPHRGSFLRSPRHDRARGANRGWRSALRSQRGRV